MEIIRLPQKMQRKALAIRRAGKRIAFVPTMGALHEGHLSLIDLARKKADVVIVSIYVNPTQFGPKEDFSRYPRPFKRDAALCKLRGADILFAPENLYEPGSSTWINEETLSLGLCGGSRPGHFRGVCTVVGKLFHLVQPDTAIFGQKDAQQAAVIERMARDLNFPVKIIRAPITREPDGLAMSSRNAYLSPEERARAVVLSQALSRAKQFAREGQPPGQIVKALKKMVAQFAPEARIDYIELRHAQTLEPITQIAPPGKTLVALAVFFGKTRLIDNAVI
ncbi:pantoate--beta-alanine ligase [Kamptonema cortianum]|nr:pantoate--beta-alanine ligase [Kamptonema cortianum]MDL5051116.1 pantoate--beta-alanine ligase [Oscillatoria amoena NRMC-F 0135]MDL5055024.1 pantoate--beta-alanine ligase [Oscillatoria laete-virens NRMC-F 0139]